jgi:F-type H+-transporting ATPase subunit b
MPHLVADAGLLDINGTLIGEVIAFIAMVLILARYVYPPIIRIATERENKIAAGVKAAEESEKRLAEVQEQVARTLAEARDQGREVIGRAHRDATGEAEEVRAKARADAEALLQRARAEIGGERDRAIQELRAEVADLVVEATSRLLGETIDRRAHQRLIDESLGKFSDDEPPQGRPS